MCGFLIVLKKTPNEVWNDIEPSARTFLGDRGPDFFGGFENDEVCCFHSRLAIRDRSSAANQPFTYDFQRDLLVFNGEVYNDDELRTAFVHSAAGFETTSDTEVVYRCFQDSGSEFLGRAVGIFSGVYVDFKKRCAIVFVDNFGVKPLYRFRSKYGEGFCSSFRLASKMDSRYLELVRAFRSLGIASGKLASSTFKSRLESNTCCSISLDGATQEWNDEYIFRDARVENLSYSIADLEILLCHVIRDQSRHVSRVGVFVSGGIDSSVLLHELCRQGLDVVPITVCAEDHSGAAVYSELDRVKQICSHLGLKPEVVIVRQSDFPSLLSDFLRDMDVPSLDGFNIWIASKRAKELGLKVCFSGLGADELFFGYSYYKDASRWYIKIAYFFSWLLSPVGWCIDTDRSKLKKLINFNSYDSLEHAVWLTKRLSPNALLKKSDRKKLSQALSIIAGPAAGLDFWDKKIYLRDVLLTDSDWASMAHGVELRVPFLDQRFQLYSAKHKGFLKSDRTPKYLLRCLFEKFYQPMQPDRTKKGFTLPFHEWLVQKQPGCSAVNLLCDHFMKETK